MRNIEKYISSALVALLCVMTTVCMTSCDSEAGNIRFEDQEYGFNDTCYVYLYGCDIEAEIIGFCNAGVSKRNRLVVKVQDNGTATIVNGINNLCEFELDFLDKNNEVASQYDDGKLAELYNTLKNLSESGNDGGQYAPFRDAVKVIKEQIYLGTLTTQPVPVYTMGAVLTSWDREQSSPYAKFNIPAGIEPNRKSTMVDAVKAIDVNAITAPAETVQKIEQMKQQLTDIEQTSATDCEGELTMSMANYSVSLGMKVKKMTGVLDKMSDAYLGLNFLGERKDMWLLVMFDGNWENFDNYKKQE
ncbi:MAG: hypothetical protein KBT34_02700 [Prevotella sp.]|nr:hypothetical protein [Candidatus Prevotella equi]